MGVPSTSEISADDPEVTARVVAALRAGGAVVLPTDTVYGLAALPHDRAATDRLFALKGRDATVPVAVLCGSIDQAAALAEPLDARVRAFVARWWPGPLTVVARRGAGPTLHLGEPADTIGLRVPDHPLIRSITTVVGPIAATSANRHGDPTPLTAQAAAASLGAGIALVVDGGRLGGTASTVVDVTGAEWRVLREGQVRESDIRAVAEAAPNGDR